LGYKTLNIVLAFEKFELNKNKKPCKMGDLQGFIMIWKCLLWSRRDTLYMSVS